MLSGVAPPHVDLRRLLQRLEFARPIAPSSRAASARIQKTSEAGAQIALSAGIGGESRRAGGQGCPRSVLESGLPAPDTHPGPDQERIPTGFRVLLSGFLGLWFVFGVLKARAGAEPGSGPQFTQSELKAGWVFNFLKTTDWPQDATNTSAPYLLGILGKDPFDEGLLKKLAQKPVNKRPIAIKRCSTADEAKACHVVFISASEKERLAEILNVLQGSSVLTIGDTDEFARLGGIIGLTIGKEQAFEYNHAAMKRSKLNIDSRILERGRRLR